MSFWGVDTSYAVDFEVWISESDVMEDEFPDLLRELNPDESILENSVSWLLTCAVSVIWVPGPDPTTSKVMLLLKKGDIEFSIFWHEEFVDPVSFFV